MFSSKSTFAGLLIVLSLSAGLLAQSGEPPPTTAAAAPPNRLAVAPPVGSVAGEASATDVAPVIDGNVLDDKAWAAAKVITGFWQTTPDEGQPASENTEVRVIYTPATLYIGVVNYDRAPNGIISAEGRRDAPLADTDSFLVLLDTFRDGQNGFVFGTS